MADLGVEFEGDVSVQQIEPGNKRLRLANGDERLYTKALLATVRRSTTTGCSGRRPPGQSQPILLSSHYKRGGNENGRLACSFWKRGEFCRLAALGWNARRTGAAGRVVYQMALTATENDNGFVTMFFLFVPGLSSLISFVLSSWISDLHFAAGFCRFGAGRSASVRVLHEVEENRVIVAWSGFGAQGAGSPGSAQSRHKGAADLR